MRPIDVAADRMESSTPSARFGGVDSLSFAASDVRARPGINPRAPLATRSHGGLDERDANYAVLYSRAFDRRRVGPALDLRKERYSSF